MFCKGYASCIIVVDSFTNVHVECYFGISKQVKEKPGMDEFIQKL